MLSTHPSLLNQLRHASPGGVADPAWARFVRLYTPLLYAWVRRLGVQETDAADLVQEVFLTLVQKLPDFQYDARKSFRSWLRTIILNKWRDRCRRPWDAGLGSAVERLADTAGTDELAEDEYRRQLVGRAVHLMRTEFAPATWKACWEHVVAGRPAAEVAAELGICPGAVYVAKARVLRRLRDELAGLLE
jgi:RNA polymerase sigma-70 factor (ECF subfamily)